MSANIAADSQGYDSDRQKDGWIRERGVTVTFEVSALQALNLRQRAEQRRSTQPRPTTVELPEDRIPGLYYSGSSCCGLNR